MTFRFRDNIENMIGYVPGHQPQGDSVIKINTNENPYPPSLKVFEALAQLNDQALRRYPPVLWDDFRQVAARIHNVDPDMIICGNGGDELLTILMRCCCDDTRPVAYPVPTYSLYPVLAKIQDNPVIEIPWPKDYSIPHALFETKAPLTILCNPNAPTGTLVNQDQVKQLADALDGVLVLDEAYVDFATHNCLPLVHQCDNVLILRSMSKGYSLAGMRFGYAIAPPRIIEAMIKVKDSYNVNIATQIAATAALDDQKYFHQTTAKIIAERERLLGELNKIGFEVSPSQSNFVLARITEPSAREIYEKLAQQQIYVRYFEKDRLNDKLRITVGTPDQMDILLNALRKIIT
ncbi:MAG: histidinol-phosphate transaminase [Planctomycetes bacterium]|nr:histidinol-phosphate transaminase [Planctomycetota bacterium]